MKRFFALTLSMLLLLSALSACGSAGEVLDYELVFVNDSDSTIVEVVVDFPSQTTGSRWADSCPLARGDTFGFEAGGYPATLAVYSRVFEGPGQKKLASITIGSAPPEGGRWYITARDGARGLELAADTRQPGGA
ncbi:MAG: hypothetical protein K2K53_03165 [Oscillospiraceae bacterium]|nr:hypothetical protein [Oscillospiraceae bacterium]